MTQRYKPWFERYPDRFDSEAAILKKSGFTFDEQLFQKDRTVQFCGRLGVDPTRALIIRFPSAFPSLPPIVFDTVDSPLLYRHHDPVSRQLCLFGFAGARWCADSTAANVIGEVTELIELFGNQREPEIEDSVPEPLSAHLRYNGSMFVPPPISEIQIPGHRATGATVILNYITTKNGAPGRGTVVSAKIGGETLKVAPEYSFIGGEQCTANIIFFQKQPTLGEFNAAIRPYTQRSNQKRSNRNVWIAIVFPEQSGSLEQTRVSWVFIRIHPNGNQDLIRGYPYRSEERMARIPALRGIEAKRVAVIGCGCLGSKIAVSLAASGIHRFSLIDADFYEPYNAVRHEAGVRSFGLSKMEALFHRLVDINPAVAKETKVIGFRIGGDDATNEQEVYDAIASTSLVIDAAGNHGVSHWVNDHTSDLNVPSVYASVTNGAWGGEVVRVIPGRTACWRCWDEQYFASPPPGESSTAEFFPPGCNQPSFTGTAYETGIVANFASSLIVDTLQFENPERPHFEGDYIRWVARKEKGIPVFKAEILPVSHRPHCAYCGKRQ